MLEFIIVENPTIYPFACATCGITAKGPIIDTHREIPGLGRVYLCDMCITRAARLRGMIEGDRHEELLAADQTLRQIRGENDDLSAQNGELREGRKLGKARIEAMEEQLAIANGRIRQLEDRARESAASALELVGGDAA